MLARLRKSMDEKDQGFTLIELLVVMIIIGILAAVAIPVFLSQRAKAQDTAAKADVSTIGKEIATYYVDNGDTANLDVANVSDRWVLTGTGVTATGGQDLGKVSDNVVLATKSLATADAWCVSVKNDKGDKAKNGFKYSAIGGLDEGTC
jgi:prepilin-type N-terminal cleavage/methylation domain-containing protein